MHWDGSSAVVALPAEIDIANAGEADVELGAVLGMKPGLPVADMSRTRFCDSAGIAALILSVEGPVTRTAPGTDGLLLEISARYLPPDKAAAYVEFARAELGEQVAIYLRPQRWLTADLGPG